eukprot:PLAT9403.1.p2 GENE.PLAT9403.1~~PLAT9403.1.p2  ORF type:complete len:344 (-),score=146.00 PLAT9403.1:62-1093(-)
MELWSVNTLGVVLVSMAILITLLFPILWPQPDSRAHLPLTAEQEAAQDGVAYASGMTWCPRPAEESALKMWWQSWAPKDETPRAIVLIVHGLHDYGGRFAEQGASLARQGYFVLAGDAEGHGRTSGLHGYFNDIELIVGDLCELLRQHRRRLPEGLPVYIWGGSMGGLLAFKLALARAAAPVAGVILVAPACVVAKESMPPPIVVKIARLLRTIVPTVPLVEGNAHNNSHPSVAAQNRREQEADPLFYTGMVRVGTGMAMLDAMLDLPRHFSSFTLPLLVIQGDKDQAVDPAATRRLFESVRSEDKTLHIVEGGYHDLTHEPDPTPAHVEEVYTTWLNERVVG